jgi:hypothetical protein
MSLHVPDRATARLAVGVPVLAGRFAWHIEHSHSSMSFSMVHDAQLHAAASLPGVASSSDEWSVTM